MLNGCAPEQQEEVVANEAPAGYCRTPSEKEHDQKLMDQQFLTEGELGTIAVLCDIILPAEAEFGSATDAGVPEFIEFIVKDMPRHQTPLRGGIMWLNHQTNKLHNLDFVKCTNEQQLALIDEIAYRIKHLSI